MKSTLQVFSMRAECPGDVDEFVARASANGVKFIDLSRHQEAPYPDVEVEFKTVAPQALLTSILDEIVDSHVMLETLRDVPRVENSMERESKPSMRP